MIDAFSAAAEPTRRRILQLLAAQPRTVGEIAAEFTVTRSAISQHLLVLAEAGLVDAEKAGRQRIYRVLPSGLQKLQARALRIGASAGSGVHAQRGASRPVGGRETPRRPDGAPGLGT